MVLGHLGAPVSLVTAAAAAAATAHTVAHHGAFTSLAAAAGIGSVLGAAVVVGALKSAALAWKEERNAERAKIERLQEINEKKQGELDTLNSRIGALEGSRDFEKAFSKIVDSVAALAQSQEATAQLVQEVANTARTTTTAIEFLARQLMPDAAIPIPSAPRRRRKASAAPPE